MGANRFSECPQCAARDELALDEDTESGHVETLREDWELGADDGDLVIDYRATCEVCKMETRIKRSITFFDTRTRQQFPTGADEHRITS